MSRLLLLLDQKENQQLLAHELAGRHEVEIAVQDADLEGEYDLAILDGPSLDRTWERVLARKAAEQPLFLPVLLVTARPDVKMITRHLWRSIDELIITPIEKPELQARIQILLRARQQSLDLRERAAAAEQSARTRDEVMAMVSHDLRNPLNLVLSSASLLMEWSDGLEPRQRDRLEAIHRAVGQMTRLVQDLLDVSGLESGQVSVTLGAEPAGELARTACRQQEHAAEARSIRLSCEVDEDLPAVRADAGRIDQVFGNLIGNALKFTPEGGSVIVRAVEAGERVRFSVSDTGIGLDAAEQERVFDRFWQARRVPGTGSGLGLAIARGILEAHGGLIGVASAGTGSEFWFELPVA